MRFEEIEDFYNEKVELEIKSSKGAFIGIGVMLILWSAVLSIAISKQGFEIGTILLIIINLLILINEVSLAIELINNKKLSREKY